MNAQRLPFYVPAVDPTSDRYNENDSDGEHGPERTVDFTARGNVYSSFSVSSWVQISELHDAPDFGMLECDWASIEHLPCFDVDVPLTEEVRAAIGHVFFDGQVTFVPSTTNYHVYVNGFSYARDDYMNRLGVLADKGIVQGGYLHASQQRHATFVRKPHIRKRAA